MAPVARGLAGRGITPTLIVTGQHPGLAVGDFELDGFPRVDLGCPGQADPHAHVRSVTEVLRPFLSDKPDLLVVQGDTSSALGGALAGFVSGTPVAHVEAGLRTHDPELPWPEEEYRVAIDQHADLLFAPTETAAANLRAEQVPGEIHVTGNTGVDTLLAAEARLPAPALRDGATPRLLVTCHRRESWSGGLESISAALAALAQERPIAIDVVVHPNDHVAAKMRLSLSGCRGVTLLAPCGHAELLRRVRDCDLVLSDSGGIQEEAPTLGTPLLVLREKTERPEAIACGNARLVGTSTDRILSETRRLLDDSIERAAMARRTLPFGDGRAGPRIASLIERWLNPMLTSIRGRNS